jgi:hypothetical protein
MSLLSTASTWKNGTSASITSPWRKAEWCSAELLGSMNERE